MRLFGQQGAVFLEFGADVGVGIEDELAVEELDLVGETALVVHRGIDIQAVVQADLVVLAAVAGRGVNAAGAGVQGDVVAEDDQGLAVVEGVAAAFAFQA